jgi:thiamine biosynthesis lipoprotein
MKPQTTKKVSMHAALHMDTIVQIKVISSQAADQIELSIARAFAAFRFVEDTCSRFDSQSEVRRLSSTVGIPVQVSPILFETIHFAWEIAHLTAGVFDPTIGHVLEKHGFVRNYLTGEEIAVNPVLSESVNYQDIVLDEEQKTILLCKPLVLDLGAVAKGLAIDLAKKELSDFEGYMIDAGGDIYVGGLNERDELWNIGIRNPLQKDSAICTLQLSDAAICTSGRYERLSPKIAQGHHLIDPRIGLSSDEIYSFTVVAPFAMMADAFSTAAFILGHEKGLAQLESVGIDGLCVSSDLALYMTNEMKGYLHDNQ